MWINIFLPNFPDLARRLNSIYLKKFQGEIAYQLGFEHSQSFNKLFKKNKPSMALRQSDKWKAATGEKAVDHYNLMPINHQLNQITR